MIDKTIILNSCGLMSEIYISFLDPLKYLTLDVYTCFDIFDNFYNYTIHILSL